jgi:hypothetical protein
LITTYKFRTKDGKKANLIIKRKLADQGATLILEGTMQVEGDAQKWLIEADPRKGFAFTQKYIV